MCPGCAGQLPPTNYSSSSNPTNRPNQPNPTQTANPTNQPTNRHRHRHSPPPPLQRPGSTSLFAAQDCLFVARLWPGPTPNPPRSPPDPPGSLHMLPRPLRDRPMTPQTARNKSGNRRDSPRTPMEPHGTPEAPQGEPPRPDQGRSWEVQGGVLGRSCGVSEGPRPLRGDLGRHQSEKNSIREKPQGAPLGAPRREMWGRERERESGVCGDGATG